MKTLLKHKNRDGSVLFTMVAVMMIVIVLVMSALTVATITQQQAYSRYEYQQAYYTAKSSLDTLVSQISTETALKTAIQSLSDGGTMTTTATPIKLANVANSPDIGEVTITIEKFSDELVKVSAKCYYGSAESNTAVYLDANFNTTILIDSAVVTLDSSSSQQYYNAVGGASTKTNGDYYITNGECTYGSVYSNGNVLGYSSVKFNEGSQDASLPYRIEAAGDISLQNGCDVWITKPMDAYINAGGEFSTLNGNTNIGMSGAGKIDIYCDTADLAQTKINGNVYVSNNIGSGTVCVLKNGTEIYGDLYVKGDLYVESSMSVMGNVYVTGQIINEYNINGETSITKNDASILVPTKSLPDPDSIFQKYENTTAESMINTAEIYSQEWDIASSNGNVTITSSGTLKVGLTDPYSDINSDINNGTVTIEVGADPIYLMLPKNFSTSNDSKIIINRTGDPETPVYFCTQEDADININKAYMGSQDMLTDIEAGVVFDLTDTTLKGEATMWLLSQNTNMVLNNDAMISGYVYGPSATFNQVTNGKTINFTTDGGATTQNMKVAVLGGAVLGSVGAGTNKNTYMYLPMPGTIGGGIGTGSGSWNPAAYTRS